METGRKNDTNHCSREACRKSYGFTDGFWTISSRKGVGDRRLSEEGFLVEAGREGAI